MLLSDICKNKCSNAKVHPWRFLMKISPFTAVEFRLCNTPKLTYSLIYYSLNDIIYGIKAWINKIKNDMSSFYGTKKGGAKCKHFIVYVAV
jgi:hypothetical protein